MLRFIFRKVKASKWYRLHKRNRLLETQQPPWEKIRANSEQILSQLPKPSQKVLFATSVGGWLAGSTIDSLVGNALQLRGAEAHALLCDRILPACLECENRWFPDISQLAEHGPQKDLCSSCTKHTFENYRSAGFVTHAYSDFLSEGDYAAAENIAKGISPDDAHNFTHEGLPVGEHAMAGTLRFFGKCNLDGEIHADAIFHRYLVAGILTAIIALRLFNTHRFDCVVIHHGIYIPQGILCAAANKCGIRVVTWNPIWRKQTFIYSHGDTYHHTLLDEPNSTWENIPWSEERDRQILDYLEQRKKGSQDWIWFHTKNIPDTRESLQALGWNPNLSTIGLLTNVLWDAQLHYRAVAFPNMLEWLFATIRYFASRPSLQLLIRIHPAEHTGSVPSRQPVFREILRKFPQLPPNIIIIKPENPLSTYESMQLCQNVLIFGTKTGVELSAQGIPVIVAGEAWVRGKGFTTDVTSEAEYQQRLQELPLPSPLTPELTERARKYAFHFIFRRMLPLEMTRPSQQRGAHLELNLENLSALLPGKSPGLDTICNGILTGAPFILGK